MNNAVIHKKRRMIPKKFAEELEKDQRFIERIKVYEKRISHKYSSAYYKNRALAIKRIGMPGWFFDKIIVDGVKNVKKIGDKQLFYVSNHKSLADFLVQGYISWLYNLSIPRFLAGENLNRFVLGRFFRRCGAIFIDRNEKDRLYWNFEDVYIKEVLLNGESLLVYPEGTRMDNLSEKLKTGTLGQIIYAAKERGDSFIVPVYVNYDKRIEEWVIDKVRENKERRDGLLKLSKKYKADGKNLMAKIAEIRAKIRDKIYFDLDLMAYFVRPFIKNKGNAYVYFGEAFSVKQFLEENGGVNFSEEDSGAERGKKLALAERVRQEIERLENIYKGKK